MKPTLLVFLFLPLGWGFLTSASGAPGGDRDPYSVSTQTKSKLSHFPQTGECGRLLWESADKRWSLHSPLLREFRLLLAMMDFREDLVLAELSRVDSGGTTHRVYAAETSESGWGQLLEFFQQKGVHFESKRRRYWGLFLALPLFAGSAGLWSTSAVCGLHSLPELPVVAEAVEWLKSCFAPPASVPVSEYPDAFLGYGVMGGLVGVAGLLGLPSAGEHERSLYSAIGRFESGRPFFILRGGRPEKFYRNWTRRVLTLPEVLQLLPPVTDSLDSAQL